MGGWLDGLFDRTYRRLGRRYLAGLRVLVMVQITLTFTIVLVLYLAFYTDATAVQWVRALLVAQVLNGVVAMAWSLPRFRRTHGPIERWLAGERGHAQIEAAWEQSKRFAIDDLVTGVTASLTVIPYAGYLAWEFGLGAIGLLTVLMWLVVVVIFLSAVLVPFIELYGRPFRLELAREVAGIDATPRVSFGNRLLASLAAVSLTTGTAVAFVVASGDLERLGQLTLISIAFTLTTSGLLSLLLQRAVMAPMEDLLAVTDLVRHGGHSARAPVTTDDEVGRLAASVNRMLDALEESATEVRASRERIIAASDQERRRIERNIHDGAQQQLVALMLRLRTLQEVLRDHPQAVDELEESLGALEGALAELRELAQGLHPSVLTTDGLGPALEQLADRATVPVSVSADPRRWPEMVESTAWFVVSEALANVGKYAQASSASVAVVNADRHLVVEVVDDGIGGAHMDEGSGLRGLADRVEAVGGTLEVNSEPGNGTAVRARLPVPPDGER